MNVIILEPINFPLQAKKLLIESGLTIRKLFDKDKSNIEIIFVRLGLKIDRDFLSEFKNLRYIVTPTTGLNHIDLDYSESKGISVISFYDDKSPIKQIRSTTELGIGLVLTLQRKIHLAVNAVSQNFWERSRFTGVDISGKNVLIIGFGRLGRQIAQIYDAFGANVSVHDIKELEGVGYPIVGELADEVHKFDILSVHVDLNATSRNLLNESILSRLKPSAIILNTSRGEVLDQIYLIKMIEAGRIAGIALDVIDDEYDIKSQERMSNLALKFPENVVITPHIGGLTADSLSVAELEITKKLVAILKER